MLEDEPLSAVRPLPRSRRGAVRAGTPDAYHKNDLVSRHLELSFEELQAEVDVSIEILHRVIEHFKAQGKQVVVVGHSYGAFLTLHGTPRRHRSEPGALCVRERGHHRGPADRRRSALPGFERKPGRRGPGRPRLDVRGSRGPRQIAAALADVRVARRCPGAGYGARRNSRLSEPHASVDAGVDRLPRCRSRPAFRLPLSAAIPLFGLKLSCATRARCRRRAETR